MGVEGGGVYRGGVARGTGGGRIVADGCGVFGGIWELGGRDGLI